jgi:hypothetical protein
VVRFVDDRTKQDEFFRNLGRRLNGVSLAVGFFEDNNAQYKNKTSTVVDAARWAELGTKTQPPRPFIRTAIDSHDSFRKEIREVTRALQAGATIEEGLTYLGEQAVKAVRESIEKWTTPPNAASTIRRKKSSHPLIDTRMMQGAVTYKIRRK